MLSRFPGLGLFRSLVVCSRAGHHWGMKELVVELNENVCVKFS